MSQSKASDSGLEVDLQRSSPLESHSGQPEFGELGRSLPANPVKPAESSEPVGNAGRIRQAVPIAKPIQSERRLPTAELGDSATSSQKVRRRRRTSSGNGAAIGIELREKKPFRFADLFTWRGLQKNLGFLISFWFHLLLFLLLSLVVVKAGIGDSPLFLDAIAAPADADEASLEIVDLEADLELEAESDQSSLDEIFEEQVAVEKSLEDAVKTIDDLHQQHADASSSSASANAGRERGDGKSATFFGTKASGRRFVFVVDRSTSMQNGSVNFRSNELFNRFDVATSELFSAISSLQPHQEFFVLMFAHNTIPMFGQESLEKTGDTDFDTIPATRENKVRLQQWVESVRMGPGTDPRLAVQVAVSMQPDAIFMLSDGQFISEMHDRRPKTLDIVRSHGSAGSIVPINTISLVVKETIPDMQEIAKLSGGKFRFTGITEYISQVANLRGPIRAKALRQLIASNSDWTSRKKMLTDRLLPMLSDPMPLERLSGETLLHEATMGLFVDHVDSILKEKGQALEQWNRIIREIDAFHSTGQVTALSQDTGDLQRLLHEALELQDAARLFALLDTLDLETISVETMISLLRVMQRAHKQFDTSSESIGWTRFFLARLDGKRVQAGPRPAERVWSAGEADQEIAVIFAERRKKAVQLYARYKDKDRAERTRERVGTSVVEKYPETEQAFLVRQDFDKARIEKVPVSIRIPLKKKEPVDPLDPFAR